MDHRIGGVWVAKREHIEGNLKWRTSKYWRWSAACAPRRSTGSWPSWPRKPAPDGVTVTVFDGLGDLPFYNEDIDNDDVPASVVALREAAADADAALVVTPEYNGSIPGVLKNAIDWLSRPFGDGALKGKPAAVVGGSFGQYGGVWAHDETRKSFGDRGPTCRRGPQAVGAVQIARRKASEGERRGRRQPARHRRQAGRRSRLTSAWRRAAGRVDRDLPAALLLRHRDDPGRSWLSVPGGKPDDGRRHALNVMCDTPRVSAARRAYDQGIP